VATTRWQKPLGLIRAQSKWAESLKMSSICITNLDKRYGHFEVLKNVSLDIHSGEFVVFVGPSGCGKSTLLRCIAGLESISAGKLEIDGRLMNDVAPSKRGIAMVFQSYALYPHLTVFDNMAYSLRLQRRSKAEISSKVESVAEKLQLTPYLNRLPKVLSGGQRQRVAIGRAIVRNPSVFLFDEPLSNLDAALRVQMRIEIGQLKEQLSTTTMIYVTHDQVEAMTMADRIVVLKDGVVQQVGTPMDLYEHPRSLFVAQFIGSPKMNIFVGEDAAKFGASTVGVRPEHLEITQGNGTWSGSMIYCENLGSDSYIYVDINAAEPIVVRQNGPANYRTGDRLNIAPKPNSLHLFDEDGLSKTN
jgi:multiple sugar transport system ATP-binding protein